MDGIARFSKSSFIAYCEDNAKSTLERLKREQITLEEIQPLEMLDQLFVGRLVALNQLKNEVNQGLILNEKGRFSEKALLARVTQWRRDLQAEHKFEIGNGYAQVRNRPLKIVQAYVVYDALRTLEQGML